MRVDDSGSAVPGVVALGVVGGLRGVASVRKAAPPVPRAGPGAPCGRLPGSHGIFGGWGLKATAGGAQKSKGQEPGSSRWSWQHPRPGQEHASAGRCCHLRPKVWQQVRLDTAALRITKGPPVPRVSALPPTRPPRASPTPGGLHPAPGAPPHHPSSSPEVHSDWSCFGHVSTLEPTPVAGEMEPTDWLVWMTRSSPGAPPVTRSWGEQCWWEF